MSKLLTVLNEEVKSFVLTERNKKTIMGNLLEECPDAICYYSYKNIKNNTTFITLKDGNGDFITDPNCVFVTGWTSSGSSGYYPKEVSDTCCSGLYSFKSNISNVFELVLANSTSSNYTESSWLTPSSSTVTLPITMTFYKYKLSDIFTYKRLKGQGLIIDGANAGRVTEVVYNGLGGNLDIRNSPITEASFLNLVKNAKNVNGKNIYLSETTYNNCSTATINTAKNKGFTIYKNVNGTLTEL